MGKIRDYVYIKITQDQTAAIHCTDNYDNIDIELTEASIKQLLQEKNIIYGIDEKALQLVSLKLSSDKFPITVAKGLLAEHGQNGDITYELNFNPVIDRGDNWNFRDVMRIPSVSKGQKLATITIPTNGTDGMNIFGKVVPARAGKPVLVKAGKHVNYEEKDHSFYAASEGQISVSNNYIHIHSVYEVNESISMKIGNLDFVGSIIIKGDLPTGYTVKAKGDVRIFGMVEAATIIAGGSVYISEGMAGLKKGYIKADENIHIGYINQGILFAGNAIYVENSILHSKCTAKNHVFCQRGNIIGGSLSVGTSIEAKDIGNKMNTITELMFGLNKGVDERQKKLEAEKKELQSALVKLTTLGEKLKNEKQNTKIRITILKQRNSYKQTVDQIEEIDGKLEQMNAYLGSEQTALLKVNGTIYPRVLVAFGKYKRKIERDYNNVQMKMDQNEIVIIPLT